MSTNVPDIDLGLILATLVSLVLGLLLGFGITALYFKRKISAEQKQLEEDKAKSQDNANIYLANAQKVLDGGIDPFINAYLKWNAKNQADNK